MVGKIILASSSPRRADILRKAKIEVEIMPSPYIEDYTTTAFSYEFIENLAYNKAKALIPKLKEPSLIIGADTVVIFEDKILGKPKTREEAFNMLKMLSGNTHHVITGIAVVDTETGLEYTSHDITYVKFSKLSDNKINDYIDNMKPYDKAGAYGIQELPKDFVEKIDGEIDNVIGLPTKILIKLLYSIK